MYNCYQQTTFDMIFNTAAAITKGIYSRTIAVHDMVKKFMDGDVKGKLYIQLVTFLLA